MLLCCSVQVAAVIKVLPTEVGNQTFGNQHWVIKHLLQVSAVIKHLPTEVGALKKSVVYEACPNLLPEANNRKCQKKLTEQGQSWSCQRCGVVSASVTLVQTFLNKTIMELPTLWCGECIRYACT